MHTLLIYSIKTRYFFPLKKGIIVNLMTLPINIFGVMNKVYHLIIKCEQSENQVTDQICLICIDKIEKFNIFLLI